VRAGADVAGGGRTRRGALQTWRPGALPGGRRGGAGGRGRQPAEVSLTGLTNCFSISFSNGHFVLFISEIYHSGLHLL